MRVWNCALDTTAVLLAINGVWFRTLDKETRGFFALFPAPTDFLTWPESQRGAALCAMDQLPILS